MPAGGGDGSRPLFPRRVSALELCLYAALLAAAGIVVWRRPVAALFLFVVGLAVHNAVMAALYTARVRGGVLPAGPARKEILLAVALVRVARDAVVARRLPFAWSVADSLALAFAI